MGCSLMFLSGCFTVNTILSSQPIAIGKNYKVDAVESAAKLPNGDIVLFAKGRDFVAAGETKQPFMTPFNPAFFSSDRVATGETKQPSSFALLIPAKEIQEARELNRERRQSGAYTPVIAIRGETHATEGGTPMVVLQNLENEEAIRVTGRNAAAILVRENRLGDGHGGFITLSPFITWVEQRDDGSVIWISIRSDAKDVYRSRRKNLWWLPVTIVGDVVTSPLQIAYAIIALATGYKG